ncbi:MAG: phosphatase PAP2 family protein [Aestuariivirga sp.]
MKIDLLITQWLNSFAAVYWPLDQAMILLSAFGVPIMVVLVATRWWRKENRGANRNTCLVAGLSFLLGLAINQLILLFVHRIRPYDAGVAHLIIAPSADWSFPSDHATAVAAIVASAWLRHLPRAALALGALGFIVCISRVFVGIRYASDVLGGVATGVIAAFLVQALYQDENKFSRWLVKLF